MTNICTVKMDKDGCISLAGPMTFESVPSVYKEAENVFQDGPAALLIDLSGITAADSAGLALLLEWQAMQQAASRDMEIRNAPSGLLSLARLCEADDVMKISGRDQQT